MYDYFPILSVSGQLPHTLDLSWFEEVENWGVKDPVPFQFSDYDYFQTRKNEAIYRYTDLGIIYNIKINCTIYLLYLV